MSEAPLLGDDYDDSSQVSASSHKSALSGSLLERIRASREAQQQPTSSSRTTTKPTTIATTTPSTSSAPPPVASLDDEHDDDDEQPEQPAPTLSYNRDAAASVPAAPAATDNPSHNDSTTATTATTREPWSSLNIVSWPQSLSMMGQGSRSRRSEQQQYPVVASAENDTFSQALLSPSSNQGAAMHHDDSAASPYSMSNYLQTFVLDFYNLFRSIPPLGQVIVVVVLLYVAMKLL